MAPPSMESGTSLGERIQIRRELDGIRQRDLAAVLGVPQQVISAWERNQSLPGQGSPLARDLAAWINRPEATEGRCKRILDASLE